MFDVRPFKYCLYAHAKVINQFATRADLRQHMGDHYEHVFVVLR